MPPLSDSSQPHFAPGCRWGMHGEEQVVLFPEGMIRVQATGRAILELCDGQRTVTDIVNALSGQYPNSDPAKIFEDVAEFLGALQQKRILDY